MPENHPAWNELLSQIPEEYHHLVKPVLSKWETGVDNRIAELNQTYEPYKQFIEHKIDPGYMINAYNLARNFEENPSEVVDQAIQAYSLDYVNKSDVEQSNNSGIEDDPDLGDYADLAKNPAFKQMLDRMEELQQTIQSKDEKDQQAQEQEEFAAYLNELKTKHGDYDQDYVVALISQGVDGTEAVKRYNALLGKEFVDLTTQQNQTDDQNNIQPPPVLNGDGNSGSGLEQQPVDFGGMKSGDVNDLVEQMLRKSAESNS